MTEEYAGFSNNPEPTTFTAKVKLSIDTDRSMVKVLNEIEEVFAGEFSVEHSNVELNQAEVLHYKDYDYVRIRFGPTRISGGYDGIESRIEDMLVRELGCDRQLVNASIVDTLP